MKVILLENVRNVGKKDEVKDVADGYAANFLIPRKLAVPLTKGSSYKLAEQKKEQAAVEAARKEEALEIQKRLKDIKLEFTLNTGKNGNTFGQISGKQIVMALDQLGIKVDKRKLHMETPVDSLGTTIVKADLYKGQVIGEINVHVSARA